jgi:opine dehydrogenase
VGQDRRFRNNEEIAMLNVLEDGARCRAITFDRNNTVWTSVRFQGGRSIHGTSRPVVRTADKHPPQHSTRGAISVAILGAGHGGLALAGYLAQQGHRVALWNRSEERIAPVAAQGGIRLTLPGAAPVHTPIALATSNIATTVAATRRILVAVPASGHADVARACAPHLRDGQTVLLLPGRTGGALEFQRVLGEAGCRASILLGEANTFPLAARSVGPATAVVFGAKDEALAAALPAMRTTDLLAAWRPILPRLAAARSVLGTGFSNVGAILHPVITLLNADRITRGDSFDFYTEGVITGVADMLQAADRERLQVARAYGVAALSLQDWIASAYHHRGETMKEAVGGNPAYVGIKAPLTLAHRYLLEDVPTGLVPLIELGGAAGLRCSTLAGLVERAKEVLSGERWQQARTMDNLGLAGLAPVAIRRLVERGLPAFERSTRQAPSFAVPSFGLGLGLIPQVG